MEELAVAPPGSEGPSAEDLRRAFSQLPPNQRAALVMRELEGRSYAEISEVIGISISALETLLFRARRALREQLEEQLTCDEASFAISKQFDGRLAPDEQRALRAHLRACPDCTTVAQRQRGQRRALKAMLAVPVPQTLASFFGGTAATGGAAAVAGGTGVAFKAAAVLGAGALVGGGGYVAVKERPLLHQRPRTPTTQVRAAVAAAPAAAPRERAVVERHAKRARAAAVAAQAKAKVHERVHAKHAAQAAAKRDRRAKSATVVKRGNGHAQPKTKAQPKSKHVNRGLGRSKHARK
jgi:hypothetical protein